jgi:histidinol dehydrogenase
VRSEILPAAEDSGARVAALRELIPAAQSVADGVAAIIADVRARGDEAVLEYTRRFDTDGATPRPLRVGAAAVRAAGEALPAQLRRALELAIANVRTVADAGVQLDRIVRLPASEIVLREAPVESAAVYVPGGRAPYPSTVVMGVVTAIAAGVSQVFVCAPPRADGELDPVVLGACGLTDAAGVYRMGGAQAIAALAYGTESVAPVDMIVGPGNLVVQ